MTNAKIDLMAPEWQMEDAYGDIRSPRYEASVAEALEAVKNLETDTAVTRENVAAKQMYLVPFCRLTGVLFLIFDAALP